MRDYLIGAGGWAYFRVPGISPLAAYSRVFNFVEVNSTFYQMPTLNEVTMWRRTVPSDFQFSVRANRVITHAHRLEPAQESCEVFEKMKKICHILKTDIMHMQTPASVKWDKTEVKNLQQFLSSIELGKLRLAFELRGMNQEKVPPELLKTMQDNNMIHCVDLSKNESPAYESDILYTRLFGKGQHNIYQPTDGELAEIDNKASNSNSRKIVMSFHFVRMYKDAVRLKTYKRTGKFPTVTNSTGIDSLEEVLTEDTKFPTTKENLIHSQGWKLFDLNKTERIHAGELLQKLPEETYYNIDEITEKLRLMAR